MSLESKRKWVLPKTKTKDVVEDILKVRDIKEKEKFLNPNIENIAGFKKLHDAQTAAKEIVKHIKKGDKIVIHGDYDADGICATSLLWDFLYRDVSAFLDKKTDIIPYIPDRVEQGYGLTKKSLDDVLDLGAKLVITVDCGVRDKDLIHKFMKEKGLNFVVTDHHLPPKDVLDNLEYTLVHQMYPKKEYPYKEICGTAVVYFLIQAIRDLLGMSQDLKYGLDLVALATVTDVMPLLDANRVFVKEGLEEINKGNRLGLRILALRAGIKVEDVDTYHLGYVLGPRINASGRIASPMEAVRLLVSNDENKCKKIANLLETTNFERQKMTTEIFEKAKESVEGIENHLLFVMGENWHEGVIGLVAGKLQQLYYKPVVVATKSEGAIKGSARSIDGFNITSAFEKFKKHLERYGGHELAAGFSTNEKKVKDFKEKLIKYANEKITKEQLEPKLNVEILLESKDITKELVNELKKLEPLGFGNPKPMVCLQNLLIKSKQVIGKDGNHLKLVVQEQNSNNLTLLLFGCDSDVDTLKEGDTFDIVGYPDINVWNGRENIQFNVKLWRGSGL
jgi:single-stranded-DNA-specific exonuclease